MTLPYLIIIFSLIGIAVITIRKIPILVKLPPEPEEVIQPEPLKQRVFCLIKNLATRIAQPQYGVMLLAWIEKLLNKIRIAFLKIDNLFTTLIVRLREKSRQWSGMSRNWMSQRRMKKIERLKLLAELNRTPEEIEENLIRTLKQNPKDIKAYRELGLLYLSQKNFQDARAAFEEVLKINPEDEVAKEKIEEIKNLEAEATE